MTQSVLVPGASGQVGLFAVALLAGAGYHVYAVSRKGRPDWYPDLDKVTWIRRFAEAPEPVIKSCHFLSLGPLQLSLDWLEQYQGTGKVLALSTSSISTKHSSSDSSERELIDELAHTEEEVKALCESAGRHCCILRPTLIYGCGLDHNLTLLLRFIKRFGFLPISHKATGIRQPIHAEDLARALLSALTMVGPGTLVSPVVGGESLSYQSMAERLFAATGKKARVIKIPEQFLVTLVKVSAWLIPGLAVNPEMVRRQSMNMSFDDEEFRAATGFKARPFKPEASDFSLPSAEYLVGLAGE